MDGLLPLYWLYYATMPIEPSMHQGSNNVLHFCRHLHVAMATWHTTHPAIVLQLMPVSVRLHLLTWTVFSSLHLAAPLPPSLSLLPSTRTFHQVSLSHDTVRAWWTYVRFFVICRHANIRCLLYDTQLAEVTLLALATAKKKCGLSI